MSTVEYKECRKCYIIKDFSEFYLYKRTVDGLQSYCKKCAMEQARKYNKTKIGKAKLKKIQSERYYKQKADGTRKNYYIPVTRGVAPKSPTKKITPTVELIIKEIPIEELDAKKIYRDAHIIHTIERLFALLEE